VKINIFLLIYYLFFEMNYIDSGNPKGYTRKLQKKASLFYKQAVEAGEEFSERYEKDVNEL
jgi:hypothetical protein